MVTFVLMVFLIVGDGQAKIIHTQKTASINECISMASQINANKQTPHYAACVPLGPSI